ncbi:hypothetical protein Adt_11164 [Abeliophyllum distichum]|uniref:Uncharacterized protein n=1 Tax=Abeliophyllum distichum TaxID=126358 RepID=A0ABD1UM34_9LAMI
MLRDRGESRVVEVYIVRAVQSHALPLVPNEGVHAVVEEQAIGASEAFEGCYALVIEAHNEGDRESGWADQFLNETIEDLWSRYGESIGLQPATNDVQADDEVRVEDGDEEEVGVEAGDKDEVGVEAGDEEEIAVEEGDVQQPRDSDTKYGDSDKLKSVESDNGVDTSSRKRSRVDAFNPLTNLEDPGFRIGKLRKHPYLFHMSA